MEKRADRVDDLITAVPGNWKFDEQVAKSFHSHVRKSIPLYDNIQGMVVELSEWFVRDGSVLYDIGSSDGETIKLLSDKHSQKTGVQFTGLDTSSAMVEEAGRRIDGENIRFIHQGVNAFSGISDAAYITSLFTLHFLPLKDRLNVLRKIHSGLEDGGAFVFVEKIRAEDSFFEDIWTELYWDYKKRQGLSDDMILQKARSLRGILQPLSLSQNLAILKSVGFTQIDVFFKWYNYSGIIAVKSPAVPVEILSAGKKGEGGEKKAEPCED